MSKELANLQKGDWEPAYDDDEIEKDLLLQLPKDLDINKFNRGQKFFKKNLGQCLIAMMMSLICGLSINRFLKVLVCTGMSSTSESSFKRYMSTTMHVLKWHYGNVWNPSSSAFKSIRSVRKMHAYARKFMHNKENQNEKQHCCSEVGHTYLSQYEMGLVQSGFMGSIVMYPDKFGIRCSIDELDDYVYFWRWIGYLLGIKDQFNICIDGYERADAICHAIEQEILIPSLYNPPPQFYPMSEAFTSGFKFYPVASVKSIIATGFRLVHLKCPFSVSFADKLRVYFARGFLSFLFYFPSFTYYLNRTIERMYQCHRFT
ncbi:uncharacterized protein LOC123528961 [Mercenaria mercenaria]|uniref:uncharacterized protein LOC123528961 n=1 Tax=Mercenaria mercenaria TaxID=6596 RepID=UPI00234ED85C|nr:uncharacterized protein LOC123528961 [Mercenaria mercenaria]